MKLLKMIPKIVEGFEIKKGEKVLLHVFGEQHEIVDLMKKKIESKGAVTTVVYRSREKLSQQYQAGYVPDYCVYNTCDSIIDIMFYGIRTSKDFPSQYINDYRKEMMAIMQILMSKEKYIQFRMPTEENAAVVGMTFDQYESLLEDALDIDYKELKKETTLKINELKHYKSITIQVEEHTLELDIENCQWYKDDGLGDLPCGEIYIAPQYKNAQGSIKIPKLILEGELFENFTLYFEDGVLIKSSEEKLMEYITSAPGDSARIAEFGIGLNQGIKTLTGYPLFDEKVEGTYHIAVGMNTAFGGENDSPLHLDFVFKGNVTFK